MKFLRLYEDIDWNDFDEEEVDGNYPYYLGYDHRKILDRFINIDDVISCFIYKPKLKKTEDGEVLDYKMLILSKELSFKMDDNGTKVYSKIDPGEHYKNESSLIVIGKKGHMFEGEPYRGVILKED